MNLKKALFLGLATGLLALGGWKAFSRFYAPSGVAAPATMWRCPMRCLNAAYGHPGKCPVCHMDLLPFEQPKAKLLGYSCPLHYSQKIFDAPGKCPFCSLELKPVYANSGQMAAPMRHPHVSPWEELEGRTAVYFRPYTVQKVQADTILRVAGRLQGTRLSASLPAGDWKGLRAGLSAMITPPQGYARPAFGQIESLGPGRRVLIRSPRAFQGAEYALAEIRLPAPASLAVPLEALSEQDGQARVFVKKGGAYVPTPVKVTGRGESFVSVTGISEGDLVAGAGVFWLEAQWRMDHPAGLP